MVHHHRYHLLKKFEHQHVEDDDTLAFGCDNSAYYKRSRPKLLSLLSLSLLSFCLILTPYLLCSPSIFFYSFGVVENEGVVAEMDGNASLCSSISKGAICCDRTGYRSDICIMKGDVRTHSASSSVFLYTTRSTNSSTNHVWSIVNGDKELQHEMIKPYTRKWETSIMDTIKELNLVSKKASFENKHHCDVKHNVPAVFFSTGGYTGNVYHEFNDGILPLYITSQHFKKKVVFVMLEYHNWWIMKYGDILSQLSDYSAINFDGDNRTHCFPEAIVGLRIHDELTVNSSLMPGGKSIVHFRNVLDRAYWPRIKGLIEDEEREAQERLKQKVPSLSPVSQNSLKLRGAARQKRPKLVILSRNGSRVIINEDLLVKMAEEIGFQVEVLRPDRTTELAKVYRVLNSSEVMMGVHGAAMTHFLFMRPGSVFIQVIPIGTEWAAEAYYGEPARKLGLKYIGYQILLRESSLYSKYDKNDPVLQDPRGMTRRGWQYTKSIYLDSQNVILDLKRFKKSLVRAFHYSIPKIHHRRTHLQ